MSADDFLSREAVRLIHEADSEGLVLRALGSVAVRLHCEPSMTDMVNRERFPKDIDLVTRKRDRRRMTAFFESRGYLTDRDMLVAMEGTRYLFKNPDSGIDVDLWVDVLDLCHKLDVRKRFGDGLTLSIEDLLLSKLQIVELTPNDIGDLSCIFDTHQVGTVHDDPEVIEADYIARLLSSDWGFWRTASENLQKLIDEPGFQSGPKVAALLELLKNSPKTSGWKIRAKIGDRIQWWQDVDVPRDTY